MNPWLIEKYLGPFDSWKTMYLKLVGECERVYVYVYNQNLIETVNHTR